MTSNDLHTKLKSLSPEKRQLLALKLRSALKEGAVAKKDSKKAKIVAYVKKSDATATEDLKIYLKKKLPNYMIPSSIIEVDEIPLLPNGKIDRTLLSTLKVQKTAVQNTQAAPRNEIEQTLVTIWESILKIGTISIHDNFFEIGGDSILSIQIIAKARKEGVIIKSNQIFENQTIAELALFVGKETQKQVVEIYAGPIPLSPIQEWFFKEHKNAPHFWNQALRFDNIPKLDEQTIAKISETLITRHDALRLSFSKQNDRWEGQIKHPNQIKSHEYIQIVLGDDREAKIEETLKTIQENATLSEDPLFKCIYFLDTLTQTHSCVLLAHHLVIDYVSWLGLTSQFEELLYETNQAINTTNSTPYYKWTQFLTEKSQSLFGNEKNYWMQQESASLQLPLIAPIEAAILEKNIIVSQAEIDSETVKKLIEIPQNTYHTKFDEILIAGLVCTLSEWTNQSDISIFLERHGRESIENEDNISNTIGWFTSFFPNTFSYTKDMDLGEHIIATKERLRQIPQGGVGYGVLKYIDKELNDNYQPSVVFNFLGFQDNEETKEANSSPYLLQKELRHPSSERAYPIEINSSVIDGKLVCSWSYASHLISKTQITHLQNRFNEVLNAIIIHCNQQQGTVFTPSDFPEADLSQDDLDNLLDIL